MKVVRNLQEEIRKSYAISSLKYMGNSNSLHSLGVNAKKLEIASLKQILEVLKLKNKEIIYTSGDSESYTLLLSNIKDDKKILTDNKEFYEIGVMMKKKIVFGDVSKYSDDVYLISTSKRVNLDNFQGLKHVIFKDKAVLEELNKYDFITLEARELPFFGCLIKEKNKELVPLLHGGKSTTKYRSGTAPVPLIVAFSKLIKLKYKN